MDVFDVVVVGSGAAGLAVALNLPSTLKVAVLSKANLTEANTYYAQGGLASVLSHHDSMDSHINDTLRAGAGLCHADVVAQIVKQGPKVIHWLQAQGVEFTVEDANAEQPHLTQEGGHSHRRVWHVADATGVAISKMLVEKARQADNIHWFEGFLAVDLIMAQPSLGDPSLGDLSLGAASRKGEPSRVAGIYVFDVQAQCVKTFRADHVVLATGGASKAYLYTSNPDVATGDGVAMAWRAGCRVVNMEFNQFHPTCLYHPKAPCFLITEAMRGEGARLLGADLQPFMHKYDERLELAPRDIVARAIDHEMKSLGLESVWLDISHRPADFVKGHFPMLYQKLQVLGLDITKEPIPVVPAAHYTCGGVLTDVNGRTDVLGLYAVGETACTGLHGANRMASNSLLECLALGFSAAQDIGLRPLRKGHEDALPEWDDSQVTDSDEDVVISHNWHELRQFMWDYVGIVRTDKRLQRAHNRIKLLKSEIAGYYSNYKINVGLLELRNLVLVSELIIRSAMLRKESRGLHYSLDYPKTLPAAQDTVLTPD